MESIETQVDPVQPKGYFRPEGASDENLLGVHKWIGQNNKRFKVGFDQFKKDMSDENNLVNTFLWLQNANPDFKVDYDTFAQDLGYQLKKKESTQTEIPFGEDGSPENSAPSPLTSSVPQPNDLEQTLNQLQEQLPESSQQFAQQATAGLDELTQRSVTDNLEGGRLGEKPEGLMEQSAKIINNQKAQRLLAQQAEDDLKKAIEAAGKARADVKKDKTNLDAINKVTESDLTLNEYKGELDRAKKQYVDEALDNGIGKTVNALNQTTKTVISQGAGNLMKSVAIMADKFFPAWMNGDKEKIQEYATYRWGEAMQNWAEEMFPTNPALQDDFLASQLPQGAGSLIAIALGGLGRLGTKAVTGTLIQQAEKSMLKSAMKDYVKGLASGSMLVGGTMMGVPEYEAAKKAGASEEEAFEVFLFNMAIGTTDAIPVGILFRRMNKLTGGGMAKALSAGWANRFKSIGKESLEQGIVEMTQEVAQNYLTNLTAANYYDKFRDLYEGMASDGAVGFVLGALLGAGAATVANINDANVRRKVEDYIKEQDAKLKNDFGPEQTVNAPEGDLGKPQTDEKSTKQPKEAKPAAGKAEGKVEKEEALPVQGVQPEAKQQVNPKTQKEVDAINEVIEFTGETNLRKAFDKAFDMGLVAKTKADKDAANRIKDEVERLHKVARQRVMDEMEEMGDEGVALPDTGMKNFNLEKLAQDIIASPGKANLDQLKDDVYEELIDNTFHAFPEGEETQALADEIIKEANGDEDKAMELASDLYRKKYREAIDALPKTKAGNKPNSSGVYVSDDIEKIELKNPKKGWKGGPDAGIEVVQLENDKWIAGEEGSTNNSGFGSPLSSHETFDSKEEALVKSAKRIIDWAKGPSRSDVKSEQATAKRIIDWATNILNENQDAIQKRSTKKAPVGEASRGSQEVEQGKPKSKPEKTPVSQKEQGKQPDNTEEEKLGEPRMMWLQNTGEVGDIIENGNGDKFEITEKGRDRGANTRYTIKDPETGEVFGIRGDDDFFKPEATGKATIKEIQETEFGKDRILTVKPTPDTAPTQPRVYRNKADVERITEQRLPPELKEKMVTIKGADGKPKKMKAEKAYVELKKLQKMLSSDALINCIKTHG